MIPDFILYIAHKLDGFSVFFSFGLGAEWFFQGTRGKKFWEIKAKVDKNQDLVGEILVCCNIQNTVEVQE